MFFFAKAAELPRVFVLFWHSSLYLFGLIKFVWQCWTKFDPGQKQILFFVIV